MGFGLFDTPGFVLFIIIFRSLPALIISAAFYFLIGRKLKRGLGIIITILLFMIIAFSSFYLSYQEMSKLNEPKIFSSYEECCKDNWCNKMTCEDEIVANKEKRQIFCEENNGEFDGDWCQLKYYNPLFLMPNNYDECIEYSTNMIYGKACQIEIRKGKGCPTSELKNRDLLFERCFRHSNVDKNSLTDNYCSIKFLE